jgi:hypothetical protein
MKLFSNGQFDVKEQQYRFSSYIGSGHGSFVKVLGKNDNWKKCPEDITLAYRTFSERPETSFFELRLFNGIGHEIGKPIQGTILKYGKAAKGKDNEEYFNAVNQMRLRAEKYAVDCQL